jgi:hypothetical protein
MYIANYKSVQTSEEFYSEKRDSLDFPTQVELSGQRYLLRSTYLAGSLSQENNIINTAKKFNIRYNIKIS